MNLNYKMIHKLRKMRINLEKVMFILYRINIKNISDTYIQKLILIL